MIVITGATGNVGRPLVQALAAAGAEVRAVSRAAEAADFPAGVEYRRADLLRTEELTPTLTGAHTVFLLTSGDFLGAGGDLAEVVKSVRSAGGRRVVLLSSQGVGTGNHPADAEAAVRDSGLDWTILRPGNFASNALQWAESVRAERTVTAPFADIALPVIDPVDIAAVAAAALLDDSHDSTIYELTGPEPVSPRQQAAALAAALGEPIRFTELSRAQATERMAQFMPGPVVESTLDILGSPAPALQQVSPDVEKVLGRAPHTFAEWAVRNSAAFQ
ncbi:SDR family oxidoreductase [Nocardia flavorosea]|uniref:NAD(P)H-binding protein n=1 Tax=Nocardia flavorosea TaxID=53429 RepID=A0A846YLK6_9NOCA|nr:NAD(P)H-binding protein [Nocardia flavorosea]NKY58490.1 NAD(P)H-binding protein [Nocardia flavorosea]